MPDLHTSVVYGSAPVEVPAPLEDRCARDARLRKHADYQRVYQASRKHFSPSMSYFYATRPAAEESPILDGATSGNAPAVLRGPRVGLTAGKVLGKAVDRNRIKRRMREAVRKHIQKLTSDVDVILHPRKFVLTLDYAKLETEVGRIFTTVQAAISAPGTPCAPKPLPAHQANSR